MNDDLHIVLISGGWSAATCLIGLTLVWLFRRWSLRWLVPAVAVVAVLAVIAGMYGTAHAMFVSNHDFKVTLWVLAAAGVMGAAGATVVGYALSRWSRSLQAEAVRFGESGTFSPVLGGPAEFQALSDELSRTSLRLSESRAREDRLEDSRRELISWVSHDLRSPLAGMRAMTEALEDGLAEDPARYHQQIRSEVDRMVRMVDDLFELSRIHAGSLRLSVQQLVLSDLVSEALASADPVARARGVRLGGSVDESIEVLADPAELSRVVSNLLMNAIRHTPADGVVQVVGRHGPGGVELAVTDGCGGLTTEDMERAFDVAWQGSAARTPEKGTVYGSGAGLGLAIVKGIVEAHRGTVTVDNHDPGCRFLVRLPATT
ncbi:MAG TPA: HAMP domain-containing sensor histidine kinase [Marmoricola sp.]|jgi:signal transduction histidine kinase|nr:HAMP domain-containing sensor histidine kinase [Marmoricola sp.]